MKQVGWSAAGHRRRHLLKAQRLEGQLDRVEPRHWNGSALSAPWPMQAKLAAMPSTRRCPGGFGLAQRWRGGEQRNPKEPVGINSSDPAAI